MANLIAYIPAITQDYLDWVRKHRSDRLWLVSKGDAARILPRLGRDMRALDEHTVLSILKGRFPDLDVRFLCFHNPIVRRGTDFILPDEDISREIVDKFLRYIPGAKISFENKFLRWDMTAVRRQEPVMPDLEVSSEKIDLLRMEAAKKLGQKSPDWWRQISAFAFRGDELLACAYNAHYPNEYEVVIFGDPRINFDAGDPAGAEVYLSLHAETGIVCYSGRKGVPLEGSSLYITEFPCPSCTRWIVAAGFKEVYFSGGYSMLGGLRTLQAANIRIVKVKDPESA